MCGKKIHKVQVFKKKTHQKPRNWNDLALGNMYQKFKLNYLGHESIPGSLL